MLTEVGVTSFLQLLGVQIYVKILVTVKTRVVGNSESVQDGWIVIDYEGFVHIFYLFVC